MTTGQIAWPFSAITAAGRELTGGKAFNLGLLSTRGLPVPDGFCVSTRAYGRVLDGNGLRDAISAAVATFSYATAETLEAQTADIRAKLMAAKIPADIVAQIESLYEAMGPETFVAVRSSGTAEDLPGASFAGMHDSYLNVQGAEAVLDAIKRCWASMWTSRAVAYRKAQGISHDGIAIAVVIQHMVDADVSGVAFTANPMSLNTSEVVINASWGLGEGVVSGIANPDQHVLDKTTGRLKSQLLGGKERMVVRRPAGTQVIEAPAERRGAFALDDEMLKQILALARSTEAFYGGTAQDIEWAYSEGRLYLLQARDITGASLGYEADIEPWRRGAETADIVWTRAFADEYWTGWVSPLFYSIRGEEVIDDLLLPNRVFGFPRPDDRLLRYYRGKPYVNVAWYRELIGRFTPPSLRSDRALHMFPQAARAEIKALPFSLPDLIERYGKIADSDPRYGFLTWLGNVERTYLVVQEVAAVIEDADLDGLDDTELKALLHKAMAAFSKLTGDLCVGMSVYMGGIFGLLGMIVGRAYGDPTGAILGELLAATDGPTNLQNVRIWALAQAFDRSPAAREVVRDGHAGDFVAELERRAPGDGFLPAYQAFIAEFGHRGHADRDIWHPRWRDDPTILFVVLDSLTRSGVETDPAEAHAVALARRKALTERVRAHLAALPFGELLSGAFTFLLDYAHRSLVLRDQERFEVDKLTYQKGRVARRLGWRLHQRGLVDDPEDVFFLGKDEAFDLLASGARTPLIEAKITARRAMKRDYDVTDFPPFLQGDRPVFAESNFDGKVLYGLGSSPGTVTGVARVIKSLGDIGRLRPGDILVTNSTDPGWTSAFLIIKGLVLESGGMLAHGAVLSREYGLPSVTAVEQATRFIPDGARITLRADQGLVLLEEP